MKDKEKFYTLLNRLCENIHGAIKVDELSTYLPINYNRINVQINNGDLKFVVNEKFQSKLTPQDSCYDNMCILQRLVYKYKINLKSENAMDKIKFQIEILKLIKENM